MSRPARSYYAAACPHQTLESKWCATIGIPGHDPEWLMNGSERALFDSAQDAEIAAYRVMMKRLNVSHQVQDFRLRGDGAPRTKRHRDERGNPKMPFGKGPTTKDTLKDVVFKNFR